MLLVRLIKKEVYINDLYIFSVWLYGVLMFMLVFLIPDRSHLLQVASPVYLLGCYLVYWIYDNLKEKLKNKRLPVIYASFFMLIPFLYVMDNLSSKNIFYSGSFKVIQPGMEMLKNENARVYVDKRRAEIIHAIVDYIKNNTSSGEKIFVVPFDSGPMFYFLTDRQNATRVELIGKFVNRRLNDDQLNQVIYDIENDKTRYIITTARGLEDKNRKAKSLSSYAEPLYNYIINKYNIVKEYGKYLILKRNE